MIWFKHLTSSAAQNQIVSKVQQKFGLEGYARLYILIETIVSQMEVKEDDPSVEHPVSKWCDLLKCKKKVLRTFFIYLQNIGVIKFVGPGDAVKVTFLNLSKLLDNRAVSSQLRRPSGAPRTDQRSEEIRGEKQEQKSVDDAENDFSWITETLKGSNVKERLPHILFKRWLENGFDDVEAQIVKQKIQQQFSSNEKSRSLGELIVSLVEKIEVIVEVIEKIPQTISKDIDTKFLLSSLTSIHQSLEKDSFFAKAKERCKYKDMTATDIAYIKIKSILLNHPMDWIQNYEKQLMQ